MIMANPLDERLKRLTDECTVKIPAPGVTGGSGFFVAPGIVLSCAHVVLDRETREPARTVTVEWREASTTGTVRAMLGGGEWQYPDLCVIELAEPPRDHPWVMLNDVDPARGPELYLTGYNWVYRGEAPGFRGTHARLDGPQDLDDARLWAFADCEVPEGMSGGPILQVRTGLIVGVVKTRRRRDSTMGGVMIPGSAIRDSFPDVWERNRGEGRNGQWYGLRSAQREWSHPLDVRLTSDQRRHLVQTAEELGLQHEDFNALWQEIADDFAPLPQRPLENILDLARELTELPTDPLDPLTELLDRIDRWPQGRRPEGSRLGAIAIARRKIRNSPGTRKAIAAAGPAPRFPSCSSSYSRTARKSRRKSGSPSGGTRPPTVSPGRSNAILGRTGCVPSAPWSGPSPGCWSRRSTVCFAAGNH